MFENLQILNTPMVNLGIQRAALDLPDLSISDTTIA